MWILSWGYFRDGWVRVSFAQCHISHDTPQLPSVSSVRSMSTSLTHLVTQSALHPSGVSALGSLTNQSFFTTCWMNPKERNGRFQREDLDGQAQNCQCHFLHIFWIRASPKGILDSRGGTETLLTYQRGGVDGSHLQRPFTTMGLAGTAHFNNRNGHTLFIYPIRLGFSLFSERCRWKEFFLAFQFHCLYSNPSPLWGSQFFELEHTYYKVYITTAQSQMSFCILDQNI